MNRVRLTDAMGRLLGALYTGKTIADAWLLHPNPWSPLSRRAFDRTVKAAIMHGLVRAGRITQAGERALLTGWGPGTLERRC